LEQEPINGHGVHESVRVGDEIVTYSYYRGGLGFRTTSQRGGPLVNGVYARLCVAGGAILKLEIADSGPGQ
jgi:hypothetical protein